MSSDPCSGPDAGRGYETRGLLDGYGPSEHADPLLALLGELQVAVVENGELVFGEIFGAELKDLRNERSSPRSST